MARARERLAPGAQIGDYLVEEAHAEGSYAVVYRATRLDSGEPAAIKLLHRILATSPRSLRRFRREVELVDRLRHPNIVRAFDFGEHVDGRPYLAMEWLPGRTLEEEVAHRGRFCVADATGAIIEVCEALAAAHRIGVVHRDLKGSNVIAVPRQGGYRMTLLDFGIAKLLDPELGEATTIGVRLGSPHAMAPEQILGDELGPCTDIYALGVLLYQLLTGELPFRADNDDELEDMHVSATPPSPARRAAIPDALDRLVVQCLAKRPERRPASVGELAAVLAQLEPPRKP
jgi:serine/threonine-protein kinase